VASGSANKRHIAFGDRSLLDYCTVRIASPVTPLTAAEIVALPELTPVETPRELTVATEGVEELQFTWLVISSVDPSLKLPVAVNGWFVPTAIEAVEGVSVIDTRVALLTVRVAVSTSPEKTAEIVLVPGCTPVA